MSHDPFPSRVAAAPSTDPAQPRRLSSLRHSLSRRAVGKQPTSQPPALPNHVSRSQSPSGTFQNAKVCQNTPSRGRTSTQSELDSRRSVSCSVVMRNPTRTLKVKRWDGFLRNTCDWNHLARDPELWFEGGDCYIHLYAQGHSRRGPSFCVPFMALQQLGCGAMLKLCSVQMVSPGGQNETSHDTEPDLIPDSHEGAVPEIPTWDVYIPAPENSSREDAFLWHLTTRNFLAFLFRKPLVGAHLGTTLVKLQERLLLFRSTLASNLDDFLDYVDEQGYRDYVNCPDYALAMLYYAEEFQLRDVWTDAWAHCVGMNANLVLSTEFEAVSRVTKASITRAYLEMDIHLGRVTMALSQFLEDDMSPACVGLSEGARVHLDRFRCFLHNFYIRRFGYWPPITGKRLPKAVLKAMYYDFENLYHYLVDRQSTSSMSTQNPANGGICVLQHVFAFNQRHKFAPLPHPLPLVPDSSSLQQKAPPPRKRDTFKLGSRRAKSDRFVAMRAALAAATNFDIPTSRRCALVDEYTRFERVCALSMREDKISLGDSRKVRWLLIYGMLQYLTSAVGVPKEVRPIDEPSYPLCCLIQSEAPWEAGARTRSLPSVPSIDTFGGGRSTLSEPVQSTNPTRPILRRPHSTIEPDCATGNYLAHTNTNPHPGPKRSFELHVPPLRIPSTAARDASKRNLKQLRLSSLTSTRSVVTSKELARRNLAPSLNRSCDDLTTITFEVPRPPDLPSTSTSSTYSRNSSGITVIGPETINPETSWLQPSTPPSKKDDLPPIEFKNLHPDNNSTLSRSRTPTFNSVEIDQLVCTLSPPPDPSPTSSVDSTIPSIWSSKSATRLNSANTTPSSSPKMETCPQPGSGDAASTHLSVEASGLLGGLIPIESPPPASPSKKRLSPILRRFSGSRQMPSLHNQSEFGFFSGRRSADEAGAVHNSIPHNGRPRSAISAYTVPPISIPRPKSPTPRTTKPSSRPSLSVEVPSDAQASRTALAMNTDPRSPYFSLGTDSLAPFIPSQMNPCEKEIARSFCVEGKQSGSLETEDGVETESEREASAEKRKSWMGLSRGLGSLVRRGQR